LKKIVELIRLGNIRILETLEMEEVLGKTWLILGNSGAGKTTLAHYIKGN
jgi:ABC-type molybdenum transport system ATPase subunit/photorepair protein PhrA